MTRKASEKSHMTRIASRNSLRPALLGILAELSYPNCGICKNSKVNRMARPQKRSSRQSQRLARRHFEILEPRLMLKSDWQNPSRPLDVNNDTHGLARVFS